MTAAHPIRSLFYKPHLSWLQTPHTVHLQEVSIEIFAVNLLYSACKVDTSIHLVCSQISGLSSSFSNTYIVVCCSGESQYWNESVTAQLGVPN